MNLVFIDAGNLPVIAMGYPRDRLSACDPYAAIPRQGQALPELYVRSMYPDENLIPGIYHPAAQAALGEGSGRDPLGIMVEAILTFPDEAENILLNGIQRFNPDSKIKRLKVTEVVRVTAEWAKTPCVVDALEQENQAFIKDKIERGEKERDNLLRKQTEITRRLGILNPAIDGLIASQHVVDIGEQRFLKIERINMLLSGNDRQAQGLNLFPNQPRRHQRAGRNVQRRKRLMIHVHQKL